MLRKMLTEGAAVPEHFSRPEVLDILKAYYASIAESTLAFIAGWEELQQRLCRLKASARRRLDIDGIWSSQLFSASRFGFRRRYAYGGLRCWRCIPDHPCSQHNRSRYGLRHRHQLVSLAGNRFSGMDALQVGQRGLKLGVIFGLCSLAGVELGKELLFYLQKLGLAGTWCG